MNNKIKKILVIKLCCIGDIIQTTPALKAVKNKGVEIHFLCSKWVDELIDMIPFIDKKIIIDAKNIFNIIKTIFLLRKEKYDLVINFHRDLKSYVFISLLGSKKNAGFVWKGYEKILTDKFVFDHKMHESLRYLLIVEELGFKRIDEFTFLKVPAIEKTDYELKGNFKIGLFPGGGKNPGTTMGTKRWPVENFIRLAEILKQKGIEIYFLGGEIDRNIFAVSDLQFQDFKIIITKNLKELAFYLSKMDLFIAGDTGPLHMAAALGVKTIGLFGPSSPELVAPPNKNLIYIWEKTECSPCYVPETVHKKEFLKCFDNKCMKNITVEDVLKKINDTIG